MTATQVRRLIVVVLAAALIILQEVIGYDAAALERPWGLTRTIAHTLTGLAYAVCAWLAWQASDSPIPGRIMAAIAFLWLPPSFIAATGRNGALWPVFDALGLFWAVLAALLVAVYPTGRLRGRLLRWILVAGLAGGVVRMVAVFLLAPMPPNGAHPAATNVYAVFANDDVYQWIDKGYRLLGATLILVIVVVVSMRWMRGTTPARNIAFIMPVALVLFCAAISVESITYSAGGALDTLQNYVSLSATAAIPISFVAGLIFIRSLRGRVSDLMVLTRDGLDRDLWQSVLSDTLRDRRLKVYWWNVPRGRYVGEDGETFATPADVPRHRGRLLMPVDVAEGRLAVIDHDIALRENRTLLEAVSTALRLSVDNGRLRTELEETLQEVRESRVRIIEAGIVARRRIERDLHDGSQQSLVSLALSLRMAIGRARGSGDEALAADLEVALEQLTGALKQLRELARGIHPSALTVGGLGMAIGELVARSPIPVDVDVHVPDRMPPLTEATVYFFIAECLTNVAKYADASRSTLRVVVDEAGMQVSVSDDGRGGADLGNGTGLMGLVDRMEALGGVVAVDSPPGVGTTVTASIPPTALR